MIIGQFTKINDHIPSRILHMIYPLHCPRSLLGSKKAKVRQQKYNECTSWKSFLAVIVSSHVIPVALLLIQPIYLLPSRITYILSPGLCWFENQPFSVSATSINCFFSCFSVFPSYHHPAVNRPLFQAFQRGKKKSPKNKHTMSPPSHSILLMTVPKISHYTQV